MSNKILSGLDIAGYIKERQAREVRSLIQSGKIQPKLAIIQVNDDPVINTYVKLKKRYGSDINVEVEHHFVEQSSVPGVLKKLNADKSTHGIIIQLPVNDTSETEKLVNLVAPSKDVDALGENAEFEPATPMAIMWLLAAYNIDLKDKRVLLIGRGKLVGAPLEKIMKDSNVDVEVADRGTNDLKDKTLQADLIITATGSPSILYSDMIKTGAVVVDAGVASEAGKTAGDLADDVYEREDIILTPKKGGVGPLTVCALFENVLGAAKRLG